MKIGKLAKAVGCSVDAIRFYEQKGICHARHVLPEVSVYTRTNICNGCHLFVIADLWICP